MNCRYCGEPIHRMDPGGADKGYDDEFKWNHDAGGPYCDNGWYDEAAGEWHEPTTAWPTQETP